MTPLVSIIVCVFNQPELVKRALDSVPRRDDIELVIVDDGSTDDTFAVLTDYVESHTELNIRLIHYEPNRGIGYAKNVAYDNCRGEYIHELDSDDYFYTEEYEKALGQLDGTDIVYINFIPNSEIPQRVCEANKHGYCAGFARFYKRSFFGDARCPEIKAAEDWHLNEALLAKPHTEKFTGINAYHYNFPREGSLFDLMVKGLL